MKYAFFVCIFIIFSLLANGQTWSTSKAEPDGNGCLSYEIDENNNRIPDFSYAGYKGGGVALPTVQNIDTLVPIQGDNTQHIQDAIDRIAESPIDSKGLRGALFLSAGTFEIQGSIYINADGIVLRGNSDGRNGKQPTILFGMGNTPHQRNLIVLGGGTHSKWAGEIGGTRQNIISNFVGVGTHSFEIEDASMYSIGDNIIIYHPCTEAWLQAIDYGAPAPDPNWTEGSYPIIFNRYITAIENNTITIDAPVYNHLDRSLSQSYIYKYDREGIVTNIGLEDIFIDIETAGGEDENHIWNAVQLTQIEDSWVKNCTMIHFGLSGVRTETASRITIRNCHSLDPVAQVTGGRMYNFNSYTHSNNILFDNCLARRGRHHFVSNGTTSVSGFVALRCTSENQYTSSEGHRHWTTGMLFDNLIDYGTLPSENRAMAFYNRGEYGSSHGWSAAHSVMWGCHTERLGMQADIIVGQPPTAQNYAIGCFGNIHGNGPFEQADGYIEGSNNYEAQLEPASLYEAQLLCRKNSVIADFKADILETGMQTNIVFTNLSQGNIGEYLWNFGNQAQPQTATGAGPHTVTYTDIGKKTISLQVKGDETSHMEIKNQYIYINPSAPLANNDTVRFSNLHDTAITILSNDQWQSMPENYALQFNGTDNFVKTDGAIVNLYPFTMIAWIKTESTSEDIIMFTGNNNSGISGNQIGIYQGKARLGAWKYDGTTTKQNIDGTTLINDGEWHMIAGIFTNSHSRKLYVDGKLEGSDNTELDNFTNQTVNTFSVGNRDDSTPSNWFTGSIDNAMVLAQSLQEIDITALYNRTANFNMFKTIINWNFDEGTGFTAYDNSSNNHIGTISGASWQTSDLPQVGLNVRITQNPKHGTATLENNTIFYSPNSTMAYDTISYTITDYTGLSSSADLIIIPAIQTINIAIQKGWNLINIPIEPQIVLIDSIFWKASHVKTLDSFWNSEIPSHLQSLQKIEGGKAYAIHADSTFFVSLKGEALLIEQEALHEGWNLVGTPSPTEFPVSSLPIESEVIKNFDSFYDFSNNTGSLNRIETGKGFFIKVNENCIINW